MVSLEEKTWQKGRVKPSAGKSSEYVRNHVILNLVQEPSLLRMGAGSSPA